MRFDFSVHLFLRIEFAKKNEVFPHFFLPIVKICKKYIKNIKVFPIFAEINIVSYNRRKDGITLMGIAASQARLLSITARLTDNEHSGQAITYSKIRLANQTEELNKEYLEALKATKLTVLTGFNGSEEQYTDISYGLMTGFNTVANGTQYVVTDKTGKILVNKKLAEAFEAGNGDYNIFLSRLGYSQSDVSIKDNDADVSAEDKALTYNKIHEAWDQYLTSVGLHIGEDDEHGLDFGYNSFSNTPFDGYPTYTFNGETMPLNYIGTTREQREFYDYATSITEAYYGKSSSSDILKTAAVSDNCDYINYLKNIFDKMSSSGYYTEDDESKTIKDNKWFEEQLREGEIQLEYYSAVKRDFISTSIDSDQAIQEVTDERELAIAEQKYRTELGKLEAKDNKFDLELKKLDTEHNALQTEYQVVSDLVKNNVEKSYKTFNA